MVTSTTGTGSPGGVRRRSALATIQSWVTSWLGRVRPPPRNVSGSILNGRSEITRWLRLALTSWMESNRLIPRSGHFSTGPLRAQRATNVSVPGMGE